MLAKNVKVKEQRRIIIVSLLTGIFLMLAKFVAFLITNSNAILTDAAESIVNVIASGFAFYSIYLTARPKDENHPYGHGKVEYFSVFLEGGLIFIAGLLIVGKATYNFFSPTPIENLIEGVWIIAFTSVINFSLGTYMIKRGKALNSLTIEADGKHLQTDAFSTVGLILGLLLIYFTGIQQLDIVISLALGAYIIYSGYRLLRKSIGGLMDESDFELIQQIASVLQSNRHDEWIDVHNLRVQRYGSELHVDCHVTLPNYFDLNKVHNEFLKIDQLINSHIEVNTELFIHADPCLPACCHYCRKKKCPIRSSEKELDIVWDINLLTRNKKHTDVGYV